MEIFLHLTCNQANDDEYSIPHIKQAIYKMSNRVNPAVRSVLIGTGTSGKINDANVAFILEAMQESNANIHLYLHTPDQGSQVAQTIQLFPNVHKLAAASGYSDLSQQAA